MNETSKRFLWQCLFFIGLIVLVLLGAAAAISALRTGDVRLEQAQEKYRQGEAATTIAARKEAFNAALALLLQLDVDYKPTFGSGKLSMAIGNTYFQLGEYPLSIFYYTRAQKLMPRSQELKRNFLLAQGKIGVKSPENQKLFDLILLKTHLSLPERLQIFFGLGIIALLVFSVWLWQKIPAFWNAALLILFLAGGMLINLGISYYFSPIEAVLIHGVELRRDAGTVFAKAGGQPIPGGTIMEVVDISKNGQWLKVAMPNGEFGYTPVEAAKLVE